MSQGHPEYLRILDQMRDMHVRKSADYGRGEDPLANLRGSAEFGIPPWVGTVIRATDKVHRLKSFVANGTLKNESVEDSLLDLASYAILALILYRERGDAPAAPEPEPAASLEELELRREAARREWCEGDTIICQHSVGKEQAGCRSCDLWLRMQAADRAVEAAHNK